MLSCGLNGTVVQWDILSNRTIADFSLPVNNAIWGMAVRQNGKHVIIACGDGHPRVLVNKLGELYLKKQFPGEKSAVLSCCWAASMDSFFCGYDDGSIRQFNYDTKQIILAMNISKREVYLGKVWSLYHHDDALVSGNSEGELQIWNARYGTVRKTIKEHQGDLTCLLGIGSTVIFTGVDSKIVTFDLDSSCLTSQFRGQSHDVNCLAMSGDLLLSGGLTTDICLIKMVENKLPVKSKGKLSSGDYRHITYFQKDKVKTGGKLIAICEPSEIKVYNYENSTFLAKIVKKTSSQIVDFAIDSRGEKLAYCDENSLVVIDLVEDIHKIRIDKEVSEAMKNSTLQFVGENLVSINKENNLFTYNLTKNKLSPTVQLVKPSIANLIITQHFTEDYVVFACLNRKVYLHNLKGKTRNTVQVAKLDSKVVHINTIGDKVLLAEESNKILMIDSKTGELSQWTKENYNSVNN